MRYFKIYRKGCTKTQPFKELTTDQFLADIADYCLDRIGFLANLMSDDDFDRAFEWQFKRAKWEASSSYGLCAGDFYLYSAGDDKTVLDFKRSN